MNFSLLIFLAGLTLGKVINPNTKHSIARLSFGTSYTFQGLLHISFDTCYITTKLILSKDKNVLIKEIGHVNNCTLSSKGYKPPLDFKTLNIMYSLCHSVSPLLQLFKNKMHARIEHMDFSYRILGS